MTVILGIDLETTSLDTETTDILEVGMIMYHVERRSMVAVNDFIIKPKDFSEEKAWESYEITGIHPELIDTFGISIVSAMGLVIDWIDRSDFILGHNIIRFDRPILERFVKIDIPTIDTMVHIRYPSKIKARNLIGLAAEHGFLNMYPHRAVFDVASTIRLLENYSIEVIIEAALSRMFWCRAMVSFENKDKAKAQKYMWDATNKFWVKQVPELYLADEANVSDFKITILESNYEFDKKYQ